MEEDCRCSMLPLGATGIERETDDWKMCKTHFKIHTSFCGFLKYTKFSTVTFSVLQPGSHFSLGRDTFIRLFLSD